MHGDILAKTGIEEEKKVQEKFFNFVIWIHWEHNSFGTRSDTHQATVLRKQSSNFSSCEWK